MMVTMTTTRLLVEIADTSLLHFVWNPFDFPFTTSFVWLLCYGIVPALPGIFAHPSTPCFFSTLCISSPITAINVGKFSRAPTRQEKARNVNTNVTESLKCQIVMHQIWPFSTQEPNLCKRRKIFYLHHLGSSSFNGCNLTSNIIFHPPKWLDWNKRDVRNKRMEKYINYLVRAVPSSDNLSLLLSLCLSLYQYYCICLCICHCAKYLVEAAPSLDNLSGFDRFLAEREAFEA